MNVCFDIGSLILEKRRLVEEDYMKMTQTEIEFYRKSSQINTLVVESVLRSFHTKQSGNKSLQTTVDKIFQKIEN